MSILPKEKTPRKLALEDNSILLHGVPKVGKSSMASQAENPIFLATEPGLGAIEAYQVPISNWNDFAGAIVALSEEKHDFKTVVVDTIDNAYFFCSEAVCRKANKTHESDFGHGKGWALVGNEFRRAILRLSQLPMGLIMISHSRTREIDTPDGKLNKVVPTLPPRILEAIAGFVAITLYATVRGVKKGETVEFEHVMYTKPRREYEAGDRTGLLPPVLPLKYEALKECFNKTKQVGGKAK